MSADMNGKEDARRQQCDEILLDGMLDNLEEIGYSGPLLDGGALKSAIEQGLGSSLYIDLCILLCIDLQLHCNLQSTVNRPQGPDDEESFQLELRSLLREMNCPHVSVTQCLDIVSSYHKRLVLVDYLLSETLAARLSSTRCQDEPMDTNGQVAISSIPVSLSAIFKVYGIKQPPPNVTVKQIFDKIIGTTRDLVSKAPLGHISPGLVPQPLTTEQLGALDRINETLTKEYEVRRQMLLTRCDVTVQSFRWSDRIKGKEDEFSRVYQSRRTHLSPTAPVSIARVLATKNDILTVHKTNSGEVRTNTQCPINKVLIGKVPDRGGRPKETRPPSKMPDFRARTVDDPRDQRKGGGARGKGGRGGRVQGGWAGKGGGSRQKGGHQKQYH